MRKKLAEGEKRSKIIGVKVKPETHEQLAWIANREAVKLSTYIDEQLRLHIKTYFKYHHIDWNSLTEEERRGEQQ